MNSDAHERVLEILLVEDNPGDVRLTKEALRETKVPSHLNVVVNGEEAIAFLRRMDSYVEANIPSLVLLDLNLPKRDGMEVLAEIKGDEHLKRIPVIVLTSSSSQQDITKAYELHANCYITKPSDVDQFFRVVRGIEEFWLALVKLPQE